MMSRIGVVAAAAVVLLASCATVGERPLPPKVEVQGVGLAAGVAGDTRVNVRLAVTNPNPYPIAIREIEAVVRVADVPIATASLAAPVTLVPTTPTTVDVEARPDLAALRQVVERALRALVATYEISGHALVQDGRRLEFHRRGELSLTELLRNSR